ncbi:PadR family transcriptional regulator [Gemmatimonadota bacterium]
MEQSGKDNRPGDGGIPAGERELLLLGLLRKREMHGYQLSEFMESHLALFFDLKKATAYNLLGKMEEQGWVSSHEEQEGKRPPRRVFAITPEGEGLFHELLRASLPEYRPAAYPGNVPILFMDALPTNELKDLLDQRREAIRDRAAALETHLDHVGHPLFDHKLMILKAELEWVDGLLKDLRDK